ncbi:MAG: nitrous oxide-stimulated promoter family protein [Muribaculaceae bacterium]|nr:nitrous oxide-stimulated promoter family protein [Muribaculaceae bacterium]
MATKDSRKEREKATVAMMIKYYCKRHHTPTGSPCPHCQELIDYTAQRIDKCPLSTAKTSCRRCTIHCYLPEYRNEIKQVMRYVGPRMIFISPTKTIRHLIDELRFRRK